MWNWNAISVKQLCNIITQKVVNLPISSADPKKSHPLHVCRLLYLTEVQTSNHIYEP